MSINLSKFKDSLTAAYRDVLNDKSDTNWALFSYEGQSNNLKLSGKGSGGIEEMLDDLNSGKIMYAFIRVEDPKTSLHKFVLLNWQGEGANTVRKGMCANHIHDVASFFNGAHITINARNEDEVDPQLIIEKVAKSASAYNFKRARHVEDPSGPIGSAYQKIDPMKDIDFKKNEEFWQKEVQELEEEKRKKLEEMRRVQEESRRMEESKRLEAQLEEHDVHARVNHSDLLRKQRNQEVQELISQRTVNARSVFENADDTTRHAAKQAPEKPVRNSILKQNMLKTEAQSNGNRMEDTNTDEEAEQFSTIKRSPKDIHDIRKVEAQNEAAFKKEFAETEVAAREVEELRPLTEGLSAEEPIYQDFGEGLGLQARALYDYQAADDTEITFDPGDVITNIDQVDEGWWQGLAPDGTYGLFPANYVEVLP